MAKIISICEIVIRLAKDKYGGCGDAVDFPNKMEIAKKVIHIIDDMVSDKLVDLETTTCLEYDFDGEEVDIYTDLSNNISESSSVYENSDSDISEYEENSEQLSQQVSQEWQECVIDNVKFTYQEMVNILSFYDKAKKRKLDQTKRRYAKVLYHSTILRIREYVNKKSTVANKFKEIEDFVIHRFNSARLSMFHVSELDLIRWGITKAREVELNFKASRNWLHSFKLRNRIVARKITKYVTVREIENQSGIEVEACSL
ncbi:hypothetical protein Fcan01_25851 [Folsomia candida]|uniref:HTH CENPB-type domain-containing protein n=1 Tax=Folsomia candida TaxID=158441 RepID=A0A226D4S1_FOLCA|nr:hypothetical protein Fcan01_25851 [Folsomia candida]